MKNQALFSPKAKSKKLKCRLLQFLFGALKVKTNLPSTKRMRQSNISQSVTCSITGKLNK